MAVDGKWNMVMKTPMGEQKAELTLKQEGSALTGEMSSDAGATTLEDGKIDGDSVSWVAKVTSPMSVTLEFDGKAEGDTISGNVKLGAFGSSSFTAERA